jgi:hypothetical protein
MDFVCIEVKDVKVVFPHFLKPAQIFVADGVAFVKSCALKFSGANFG